MLAMLNVYVHRVSLTSTRGHCWRPFFIMNFMNELNINNKMTVREEFSTFSPLFITQINELTESFFSRYAEENLLAEESYMEFGTEGLIWTAVCAFLNMKTVSEIICF